MLGWGDWRKLEKTAGEKEFTPEDPQKENPVNIGFSLEPVVGIEPTTYGLRIRRQFLDYAKTAANVHFIEMVEVRGLACLTCSTVAPCCAVR